MIATTFLHRARGRAELLGQAPRCPTVRYASAQFTNGKRPIKRVFKTSNGWMLRSMNEAYPPREVSLTEVHAVHVIKHSVARM